MSEPWDIDPPDEVGKLRIENAGCHEEIKRQADRIEQLEGEVERLLRYNEDRELAARDMADTATARIAQLEAALREIEYLDRPQVRGLPRRVSIQEIARTALGEERT